MKNKMKDYEAKYEECQKIAKEYFTKELEKNLVQHKTNERIMRYKLEAYEKKNSNIICGNPTSIEVLCQDEETKAGPNGTSQEKEVQTEESQDLRSGTTQKEVHPKIPHDLKGKGYEEKNQREFRNRKRWRLF